MSQKTSRRIRKIAEIPPLTVETPAVAKNAAQRITDLMDVIEPPFEGQEELLLDQTLPTVDEIIARARQKAIDPEFNEELYVVAMSRAWDRMAEASPVDPANDVALEDCGLSCIPTGPSWDSRDPTRPGADKEFRVALMKDHTLKYPDLYLSIFVAGSKYEEAQFAEMFTRASCYRAKSLAEADICVFTGGPDVDPRLYGEEPHREYRGSEERDTTDINLYMFCLEHGIPMFGVCRGAQFLHVMNGGKLYQHINHHHGDHTMYDVIDKRLIERVSSVHHQMCIENIDGGMTVIGTSSLADQRWENPTKVRHGTQADIEAYFYRDTCCFGVQGHPEYRGYNYFTKWTLDQIEQLVILNPDIDWRDGCRRIKPALLEQRGNAPIIINPKPTK